MVLYYQEMQHHFLGVFILYEKVSLSITDYLISKGIIDTEKKEIYAYGFEILISYICYFIIEFLIAIVTKTVITSILFFSGFILIRRSAGGYHASTYIKCHILFALNHILFIGINAVLPKWIYLPFLIITPIISMLAIFSFAPVDHENRDFNDNEYKCFKKRSRMCSVIIFLITLVCVFFEITWPYIFSALFGVLSATISLIVAYCIKRLKC